MTNSILTRSVAELSERDLEADRATAAYPSRQRQLLTGPPRELPFGIDFRNGERVEITLTGSGSEPSSHWRVFSALKRLAALEPNWDSYGARSVSSRAVRRSVGLLASIVPVGAPEPSVVPTSDGGIQFEWHRRGVDVEVTVPPQGEISYLIADASSEEIGEGVPDATILGNAFARMKADA